LLESMDRLAVDTVGGFFTLLDKIVDRLEHVHHLENEVEKG
jgi:hypothetical protein